MSIQGPTSGGTYFPPSDFTVNTPGTPAGEKPSLGAIAQPPSPPVSDGIETNPDHPPQARARPPAMCARRWPTCPPTKCRPTCTP